MARTNTNTGGGGGGGSPSAPDQGVQYNNAGSFFADSLFTRDPVTQESQFQFEVAATAEVNDGISEFAQFKADTPGTGGNSIALVFDGVDDINTVVANWNIANPSNTVTIVQSTSVFVPPAQTVTFAGGGTAGYVLNRDLLGQGIQIAGSLFSDGANRFSINGFIDSATDQINPFITSLDLGTGEQTILQMEASQGFWRAENAAGDAARVYVNANNSAELIFENSFGSQFGVSASGSELRFTSGSYDWIWANVDGAPGDVLTTDGAGNLSFQPIPPAAATLTQNYIGVGDSINELNGYASFQYDPLSYIFTQTIPNNINNGTVLGSPLTFGAANWNNVGVDDLTLNWSVSNYQSEKYGGNLTIQIDGTGTPDTFYWIYTGSYSQVLGGGVGNIPITPGPISLTDVNGNVIAEITFGSTTGHTGGEVWTAVTSLFVLGWGMSLLDGNGHEFVRVNPVTGSYTFGDDNTPNALAGNGTRLEITDNVGELGLFAKRYFRVEAPGGDTAVLADMINQQWDNYGMFSVRNSAGQKVIEIDSANEQIQIGDPNSNFNLTNFVVNNISETILANTDGVFSVRKSSTATDYLKVDVANNQITINVAIIPTYADDATATGAGLVSGNLYKTTTGGSTFLKIVP